MKPMKMLLPNEIRTHSGLCCSYLKRSIGTHIWLEFGIPKISRLRHGGRTVTGDMTLHVSSCNWRLMLGTQCALNSDTVTDRNFAAIGKKWIVGHPVLFEVTEPDLLELSFSTEAKLEIYPTDEEDDDAEVSLKLPDEQ